MMPYRAYIEGSVRRDAARSTSLRIRQPFSPGISVPRLSPFAYAGGGGINPGRELGRMGDMHPQPSIYVSCGIIGVHISFGITGGCQCARDREPAGNSRSFTSPAASFRMTKISFVQDDNTAASSMVTRNVFLSVAKNLMRKPEQGPRVVLQILHSAWWLCSG